MQEDEVIVLGPSHWRMSRPEQEPDSPSLRENERWGWHQVGEVRTKLACKTRETCSEINVYIGTQVCAWVVGGGWVRVCRGPWAQTCIGVRAWVCMGVGNVEDVCERVGRGYACTSSLCNADFEHLESGTQPSVHLFIQYFLFL